MFRVRAGGAPAVPFVRARPKTLESHRRARFTVSPSPRQFGERPGDSYATKTQPYGARWVATGIDR